jgi:glutamine synthetase
MTELTYDNIEQVLEHDDKVKVVMVDMDGVLRGKILHKEKFLKSVKSGYGKFICINNSRALMKISGVCTALLGWDVQDHLYSMPNDYSGSRCSFNDMTAKIDLATFRRIPWEDNVPLFLINFHDPITGKPVACCPRNVLKSAVDDFEKEMGMTPYCGVEFEFYCFKGKCKRQETMQ